VPPPREARVHHARLQHGAAEQGIDPQDPVHPGERDQDRLRIAYRPARETGACSARHEGDVHQMEQPEDVANLGG